MRRIAIVLFLIHPCVVRGQSDYNRIPREGILGSPPRLTTVPATPARESDTWQKARQGMPYTPVEAYPIENRPVRSIPSAYDEIIEENTRLPGSNPYHGRQPRMAFAPEEPPTQPPVDSPSYLPANAPEGPRAVPVDSAPIYSPANAAPRFADEYDGATPSDRLNPNWRGGNLGDPLNPRGTNDPRDEHRDGTRPVADDPARLRMSPSADDPYLQRPPDWEPSGIDRPSGSRSTSQIDSNLPSTIPADPGSVRQGSPFDQPHLDQTQRQTAYAAPTGSNWDRGSGGPPAPTSLTMLLLFGSIGLNLYLFWIAWDTYNRYQDLVAEIRSQRGRRERSEPEVLERVAADY